MATHYLTKDAWNFQYKVDTVKPFYTALMNQGCIDSATPVDQTNNPGTLKVIFPGSTNSDLYSPVY